MFIVIIHMCEAHRHLAYSFKHTIFFDERGITTLSPAVRTFRHCEHALDILCLLFRVSLLTFYVVSALMTTRTNDNVGLWTRSLLKRLV